MRSGRLSFFAAAAWLVPIFVFLMMKLYVEAAAERERGSFIPGLGAFVTQVGITAGLAFSLGLLSMIRRERLWWVATIPCFVGGFVLLPILLNIGGSAVRAMQPSVDLIVGILMALNGVFFLAWSLPTASARLARERQTDGTGEKDAPMETKVVKLFGIASLAVGVGLLAIHAFDLF